VILENEDFHLKMRQESYLSPSCNVNDTYKHINNIIAKYGPRNQLESKTIFKYNCFIVLLGYHRRKCPDCYMARPNPFLWEGLYVDLRCC
jgi:hypothetical protein